MNPKIKRRSILSPATAFLVFCSALAHSGTTTTTFSFQQGDLQKDGSSYGSGGGYAGVVDGRVTDNTATSPRSTTATATLGNQFQSGTHNGQQHCGLFSYDLTELNDFITANTGPFSTVTIQAVSFKLITSGTPSGGSMALNLYGTDPFTATGSTWSNYTTGTPWTIPYQSGRTETTYNFTGGPSALTPSLGGTSPTTGTAPSGTPPTGGTPAGTTLTWSSSANFISALTTALARDDKTLYLTVRGSFFNTGDNRVNVHTGSATALDNRPELLVTLDVTTTAPPATWTGANSNSWTTATNWSPSGVPEVDAPIIFDNLSTANLNTVLNQDFTITSVTVSNPSGAVSISGANNLNLGAGGFDLSTASQNLTVSSPIVLGAVQSWNVASGRTLGVNGAISGNFAITIAGEGKVSLGASNSLPNGASAGSPVISGTLDLNGTTQTINGLNGAGVIDNTAVGTASLTVGANDANGTFSGVIRDTGGALAVVKTGTGNLTLTGANEFEGGFTNNGSGNVVPNNNLAFGAGPVVSNAGQIYPTATTIFANSLALNNSTLRIGGGNSRTITWNGPVTATGASGITADGSTGGITLGSTLDITGATLTSSANGTTNNIVGNISGAGGNLSVTLGTLQVSGANNTYGGTTTIGANCFLRLDATGTLPASTNITNNGGLTIRNTTGWTHNGAISGTGVVSLNTGTNATLAGSISGMTTIAVATAGTNASISGAISGGTNVNVQNTGATLTLSGANDYTGTTTVIGGGILALGANNTLPNGSNVTIGAATLNVGTFTNEAGTLDVTAAATIQLGSGGTIAFADSSGVDWTGGTLNITGNFVSGSSVRFGTLGSHLLAEQVALISVNGSGAGTYTLDEQGYLISPEGFSAWQSANTTAGGLGDDHDNDGVTNGIEFFIYGPVASSGFTSLPGVEKDPITGKYSVIWTKATGYPGGYGSGFVVETSSTLTGLWNVEIASPIPGFTVTFPSANEVKYTFPEPLEDGLFVRLRVNGP